MEYTEINKKIYREYCENCEYRNYTNACHSNRYKKCTEYGKEYFDSVYKLKGNK